MTLVNSDIDHGHRSNPVLGPYLLPFYGRNLVNLPFCHSYFGLAEFILIIQSKL